MEREEKVYVFLFMCPFTMETWLPEISVTMVLLKHERSCTPPGGLVTKAQNAGPRPQSFQSGGAAGGYLKTTLRAPKVSQLIAEFHPKKMHPQWLLLPSEMNSMDGTRNVCM